MGRPKYFVELEEFSRGRAYSVSLNLRDLAAHMDLHPAFRKHAIEASLDAPVVRRENRRRAAKEVKFRLMRLACEKLGQLVLHRER